MKKQFLILVAGLILSGCTTRSCSKFNRKFSGPRNYSISCYSGGKLVKEYHFRGVLNNQENSDGYYFFDDNGMLVEVSGDVIVESK